MGRMAWESMSLIATRLMQFFTILYKFDAQCWKPFGYKGLKGGTYDGPATLMRFYLRSQILSFQLILCNWFGEIERLRSSWSHGSLRLAFFLSLLSEMWHVSEWKTCQVTPLRFGRLWAQRGKDKWYSLTPNAAHKTTLWSRLRTLLKYPFAQKNSMYEGWN